MIRFMMLIVAIACFIYGIYVLVTGKNIGKEMEAATKENKRYYARICGIVMLAEAIVVGIGFYMETVKRPYSSLIFLGVIGALAVVLVIAKRILSK